MDKFKGKRIEYHILQSFPVTCLNRDDVGAPKSAMIGGVERARVSSQCWKRQVRMALHDLGVTIGVRTKKLSDMLEKAFQANGATEAQAISLAAPIATALTDNTLLFFSESEAECIARFAKDANFNVDALVKQAKKASKSGKKTAGDEETADSGKYALTSELKNALKSKLQKGLDGLDIALFGRMVAQDPDMNMQAATCFAHAITTHRAINEIDFFTALDDLKTEVGSAHIGALEFNSGTYYRYVSLDLGQLAANIGAENVPEAVKVFTRALYIAVPAARQTTQAGLRPWDFARVLARKGQGMQASFEKPVRARDGYLEPSIEALETQIGLMEKQAGSLYGKIADFSLGKSDSYSIDDLAEDLAKVAQEAGQ